MRIINVAVTDHRLSIRYRFSRKGIAAVVDHARALKENPSSLVEAVVMSGVRDAARIPRADFVVATVGGHGADHVGSECDGVMGVKSQDFEAQGFVNFALPEARGIGANRGHRGGGTGRTASASLDQRLAGRACPMVENLRRARD
jgi:hypothetical protein